jgi:branched-chain amino acid transport system ATP-binding protein
VFGFADRVIVLDRGKIIAEGTPAAVRADSRVQAVYLGDAAGAASDAGSGRG